MTIPEIPDGQLVLLDANIVLYALRGASKQCAQLLRRCASDEVRGFLTTHILAEVAHRLMLAEARENGWIAGRNLARELSDQPGKIRLLSRYEQAIKNLLATGIRMESVVKEDFLTMIVVQRQYGLLTNDALLAAVADRLRIDAIASADKALALVGGVIVYEPDDIV
jgi:predicted nucleic acid-binding protein